VEGVGDRLALERQRRANLAAGDGEQQAPRREGRGVPLGEPAHLLGVGRPREADGDAGLCLEAIDIHTHL